MSSSLTTNHVHASSFIMIWSSRNQSTVKSLMTSLWGHSIKFVNTGWIYVWWTSDANLLSYCIQKLETHELQVENDQLWRHWWRHSIKFVNTSWLKTISSFVKIGCKLIKLLYSQFRNILKSSRNWSAVTSLMTSPWRNSK